MPTRALQLLLVPLCIIAFVGCEGETGPAGPAGATGGTGPPGPPGPSFILAFGDIDIITPGNVVVRSSGPSGVNVSVIWNATGHYSITVTGSFPSTEGTLIVSLSTGGGDSIDDDRIATGEITSWTTGQIVFDVNIWDTGSVVPLNEDCSFVLLGD